MTTKGCRSKINTKYGKFVIDLQWYFNSSAWQVCMSYKPEGFRSITPYLMVHNADVLLDFLTKAFNAEVKSVTRKDERIMNAEVLVGDSIIEIGERPQEEEVAPIHLHYYVEDVREVFSLALKHGGKELYSPQMQNYGDLEAGIEDPSGNSWYIATHVDPDMRKTS